MPHSLALILVFVAAGLTCGMIAAKFIQFERLGNPERLGRRAQAVRFRVVRITPEMGVLIAVTVLPLFGLQYGLSSKTDKLDFNVAFELGKTAAQEGHFEDALAKFQEAKRLNNRDERVYTNIGVVYFLKAEREPYGSQSFLQFHKSAVESHMNAIGINSNYARAYSNMGMSLYQLGRKDEAIHAEKKAVGLKPDEDEAYYNLACMYALEGHPEDALHWLGEAIDHGYENLEEMSNDATLGAIRDTPEFRKLQERVRHKQTSTLQTPAK